MFQSHIHYILGDMIPPNQGSSLSKDSSLNKTPWENFYILGYEGPNEISQDVSYRAWTVTSMIKFLDPEGETVTCGSLYKFSMMSSPQKSHLGKLNISPTWRIHFFSNLWVDKNNYQDIILRSFIL